MTIDLQSDATTLQNFIRERSSAVSHKSESPVRMITVGFQFDQAGWAAIDFDSRPNASPDGSWQSSLKGKAIRFPSWQKAFASVDSGRGSLDVRLHNGRTRTFKDTSDEEAIAACIGDMCRHALEAAYNSDQFKSLGCDKDTLLVVEEHDGRYGWVNRPVKKRRSEKEKQAAVLAMAAKLTKPRRLEFWLEQLECLATERPCASADVWGSHEFVIHQICNLGLDAIVRLLDWSLLRASKSEWRVEKTTGKVRSVRFQHAHCAVFWGIRKSKVADPKIEERIRRFIRKSTSVKPVVVSPEGRRKKPGELYGVASWHAADVLNEMYDGYPKPIVNGPTNRLVNAAKFFS